MRMSSAFHKRLLGWTFLSRKDAKRCRVSKRISLRLGAFAGDFFSPKILLCNVTQYFTNSNFSRTLSPGLLKNVPNCRLSMLFCTSRGFQWFVMLKIVIPARPR
jgi:hypothetical protein